MFGIFKATCQKMSKIMTKSVVLAHILKFFKPCSLTFFNLCVRVMHQMKGPTNGVVYNGATWHTATDVHLSHFLTLKKALKRIIFAHFDDFLSLFLKKHKRQDLTLPVTPKEHPLCYKLKILVYI